MIKTSSWGLRRLSLPNPKPGLWLRLKTRQLNLQEYKYKNSKMAWGGHDHKKTMTTNHNTMVLPLYKINERHKTGKKTKNTQTLTQALLRLGVDKYKTTHEKNKKKIHLYIKKLLITMMKQSSPLI